MQIIFYSALLADSPLTFLDSLELNSIEIRNVFHLEDISYADSIVSYDPGALGKNTGGEPDTACQNSWLATGSPDFQCVCLGNGGNIILNFKDNVLINGPGPDLYIYQTDTINEEILVWISNNGKIYRFAGKTSIDSPHVDIDQVAEVGEFYTYVKLKDNPNQGEESGPNLGANIDAISAIHTALKITIPTDSIFQGENTTWKDEGYKIIEKTAQTISKYNNIHIKIFVHTHQAGTSYFNQIISQQRASAIKNYLIDKNFFSEDEIQAFGLGNKYPILKENEEKAQKKNRRVEIFVHPSHITFPIKRR